MTLFGSRFGLAWAFALGVPVAMLLAPVTSGAAGTPGVVIVRTDRAIGPGGGTRTTTIKLTHNAVRIDSDAASIIYRRDLDTAWMIQGGRYMVMSKEAARAVKNQMATHSGAMKAEMDKALATMPPDKRALVEKMMREQGVGVPEVPGAASPPPKPPVPTYTKGARDKVGPWGCDVYDGKLDGRLAERVCATGIVDLGLKDGDIEIMLYAAEYFWELGSEFGGASSGPPPDLLGIEAEQGFPGYALNRKRYKNGELAHDSTVTKAERVEFDPSLFAKPNLEERKFGVPPQGAPK